MRVPDLPQCLHSKLSILRRAIPALMLTLALFVPAPGVAATATFGVGIDTDNDPATGCTLATANGPVAGIEIARPVGGHDDATGATVTRLEQQRCNAGSLSASAIYEIRRLAGGLRQRDRRQRGDRVLGTSVDAGSDGRDAGSRVRRRRQWRAGRDRTVRDRRDRPPRRAAVVPVPLSPWLVAPLSLLLLGAAAGGGAGVTRTRRRCFVLLAFVAGSGLVWAATVLRDGNVGDWAGVAPAVTDAKGDAPANADIVAVFVQQDGANLYLRIDADIRKDAAANQAPVVNAGTAQTVTLPASANLAGSATDDGLPNPPGCADLRVDQGLRAGDGQLRQCGECVDDGELSARRARYVLRLTANDGALTAQRRTHHQRESRRHGQPAAGRQRRREPDDHAAGGGNAGRHGERRRPAQPAGALTTTWSLVSGPASGVFFANPALPATTATFSAPGTYVLRLTASDGAASPSSTVEITVNDGAPQLDTIANRTIEAGNRLQILLQARDGNANDALTYELVTAPAGATLNPAPLIDWVPTVAQAGRHTFTARVTDANGSADDHLVPGRRRPRQQGAAARSPGEPDHAGRDGVRAHADGERSGRRRRTHLRAGGGPGRDDAQRRRSRLVHGRPQPGRLRRHGEGVRSGGLVRPEDVHHHLAAIGASAGRGRRQLHGAGRRRRSRFPRRACSPTTCTRAAAPSPHASSTDPGSRQRSPRSGRRRRSPTRHRASRRRPAGDDQDLERQRDVVVRRATR